MRVRTSPDKERQIVELVKAGLTSRHVAASIGVSIKTVQNVFNRHSGIRRVNGRPNTITPLTDTQIELVAAFQDWARRVATRMWRSSLERLEEREEYISSGYIGLIKAASRWRGEGVFQKLAFVWIKGEIKTYRRTEMLANGWGVIDRKVEKILSRDGFGGSV